MKAPDAGCYTLPNGDCVATWCPLHGPHRRVLMFGSRDWTDWATPLGIIMGFREGTVVIEGEARGADRICRRVAEACGFWVIRVPADWNTYGKAAGPIRNGVMMARGPDFGIGFHTDVEHSKGSKDMKRRLEQAGKAVVMVEKTR